MHYLLYIALSCFCVALAEEKNIVPSIVIGGGMGGVTAAIYLARSGLKPLVLQGREPGGVLTQSYSVENWPGEICIAGDVLMERILTHAKHYGASFLEEEVVKVDFSKRPFAITTRSTIDSKKNTTFYAASCIIATGATPNRLHIPGEEKYWGRGVSSCAICDGSLYKGRSVAVVGGGDSAVVEALYLSNLASEVHLFVRKDNLKATDAQKKKALFELPHVKIHYLTTLQSIEGTDESVNKIIILEKDQLKSISVDGIFLAIGSSPNTNLFEGQLDLDKNGYIIRLLDQQTSIPYVYAVGDVSDPLYKQAISAAAEGAKAALQLQEKLTDSPMILANYKEKQTESKRCRNLVVEIKSTEHFEKELQEAQMPIVVDFYATWCNPCKRIAPRLEESADGLLGKVKFLKINVDHMKGLARIYQIKMMPTVLYFDEAGVMVEKKVGEQQIDELLGKLKGIL